MMTKISKRCSPHLFIILVHLTSKLCDCQLARHIGNFGSFAHNVNSGPVWIVDEKRIHITDFEYDGQGPAAWLVVGRGPDPFWNERVTFRGFTVIPDETLSCDKLKSYNRRTIELTLPGDLTFNEVRYISVYCLEFQHNFGYIGIPKNITFPLPVAFTNLRECRIVRMRNPNPASGGQTWRDMVAQFFQGFFGRLYSG